MVRKHALVAMVAASVLLPVVANAGFKDSYSDWLATPPVIRDGYVMGALDYVMNGIPMVGNPLPHVGTSQAVRECGVRLKLNTDMVREAVTDAYRANPDLWGMAPVVMLQYVVYRMCGADISQRVLEAGEAPASAESFLAALKAVVQHQAAPRANEQPSPRRR